MPRTGKGSKQPAMAAGSQAYGLAGEQKQAQAAMPLPNAHAPAASPSAAALPPGGGVVAPPSPGGPTTLNPMAMALGAAQMIPQRPSSMAVPTMKPHEPVTAGLPSGAGPGPEALGVQPIRPDPVREVLEAAAVLTGSPRLMEAARRRG